MKKQNYFKTIFLLLLFSINISAQVPSYVPSNGLVGWWPFTGNTNDLSGNGNNGTNYGATLTTDRFSNSNSAYSFNGTSNYIQAPNYALQGSITFSGWYKMSTFAIVQPDAIFFSNQSPLQASGNSNAVFGWRSSLGQNGHAAYLRSPFTGYYPINQQVPSVNVWHHFVAVFDNGVSVKMYLDNNLIYTNNSVVNNSSLPSYPMLIGNAGSLFYYSGQLDDIGIWNRALTSCEINQLYTASLGSNALTNGLVGWWPFTGNANDLSGNGNNGANNGATLTVDRFSNSNSAYNFNGSSDFIQVTHNSSLTFTTGVSFSFWLNVPDSSLNTTGIQERQAIGKQRTPSASGIGFETTDGSTPKLAPQFYIQGGAQYEDNSPITINTWHHLVGTYDGTILKLYKNSFLIGTNIGPFNLSTITQNLFFGKQGALGCFFKGKLDDIGIWNRELTSCEINQLYTASPGSISVVVSNSIICAGQSATLSASGANSYTWSNSSNSSSIVVSPSLTTTYSVAGSSSIGWISTAINLTVNPSPIITVNNGTICSGQNFSINPTGANTYTIQGGNAVVSPSINTTYTVIGTSTAGCVSQAFATSSLTVNPNPIITVNNGSICAGQSFTINPTGANTYTIQGGNAVVSPSINTTYTVIGTSTAGCVSQAYATSSLTVNNPIITVNSGAICIGESFTISPNGANTYTIQGGNAVVSPTINITYTVAGTNTAGCVSQGFTTSSLTVNQCVGITNQNMGLGGVSIYPNPNNGEFTIELVSVNNTYITTTNVLGQIIKTQKAELINQINLNLFEKGVYFISVMENNQSVYRGSIIKE